jgi:EAL domain-containing protein (putative c-di-GMP-specific phosphodiesterase class I)/ActR/RegA family two-component response regulator
LSSPKVHIDTGTFRAPPSSVKGSGRAVLVVDDDSQLARSLQRVLAGSAYDVTCVSSGAEAVEAIMHTAFDVILSDIHMPGMSGVDLLSVVRAYDLDVPVILMTADPNLETAIEAVSLGALQYLVKPVPNDALLKVTARACQLRRMAEMKRQALKLLGEAENQAGDRTGLATRLDMALKTMWVAFQPIVDLSKGRIYGYEALLRCDEPSMPHPGAVLSAAERLDRIHDVGRRVRGLAAEAFEHAPKGTVLFVNLHTRDLLDPSLYVVDEPLSKLADRVVLEVTERSTLDEVKDVQARVNVLRFLGYRLALDDLGAGYAGLSSFATLAPEIVKLDMSLVRNVHQSEIRRRLVGSMTSLSREMGMLVVAEGVEVEEERDTLTEMGCDLLQGYLFAQPGRPFPHVKFL